jgi:hypothetical protein
VLERHVREPINKTSTAEPYGLSSLAKLQVDMHHKETAKSTQSLLATSASELSNGLLRSSSRDVELSQLSESLKIKMEDQEDSLTLNSLQTLRHLKPWSLQAKRSTEEHADSISPNPREEAAVEAVEVEEAVASEVEEEAASVEAEVVDSEAAEEAASEVEEAAASVEEEVTEVEEEEEVAAEEPQDLREPELCYEQILDPQQSSHEYN